MVLPDANRFFSPVAPFVEPVPPWVSAIAVPDQTPEVMVPTAVMFVCALNAGYAEVPLDMRTQPLPEGVSSATSEVPLPTSR